MLKQKRTDKSRVTLLLLLVLFFLSASAQKKKQITYTSEESTFSKVDGVDIIKLFGKVVFKHEGAIMKCDSAYFFRKQNSFDAFSNVKVNQGDTVHLSCDNMHYDGLTKTLDARGNVQFRDKKMTLVTDAVLYNRNSGATSYSNGGVLTDPQNTLYSKFGVYNTYTKWFVFKDSVRLNSAKYKIKADTLYYHSTSGLTRFRGPSTIKSQNGWIKCNYGDYDTQNDIAYFSKRCEIYDESSIIKGDSVFYNSRLGIGDLFGNVYLEDTVKKYIITGQHAFFKENPEYALVTGNPLYTMIDEGGDSLFLHGDTLRVNTNKRNERLIRVYYNTKFYRTEFQGKCDSLTFNENDSILYMHHNPVVWNGKNQLSAELIYLTMKDGELDSLFMIKNAFILSSVDSVKYDQVRGKNMRGKFYDSELRSLFVLGNGQTVYTVMDKGEQQGINRADCSNIIVRIKNSAISEIVFLIKPNAKMYPINDIPAGELYLRGFNPRLKEKPTSKKDLFLD